ncbi:glycosyltransferase [Paenibacillus sp. PAMC21692]|uniref:glycosyltransferase n=1 Tax=Paenibacillus sp. PAMC21692 TaxID=2762320 RepID=UPI00164E6EE7|nr:glycosyltransferase [Paenibacillus sp. PAMC21692]QNK59874.1 glycosyltransferase [Paenibacillus sp. PAMC21692]
MKKKLLFIMPGLGAGGGERSLVTLLSQIDYEKYDVDLFLFKHDGIFMKALPEEVNVIKHRDDYLAFTQPFIVSLKMLFGASKFRLLFNRILFSLRNQYRKGSAVTEQSAWQYLSMSMDKLQTKYDAAIGFLEKTSIYYCIDKVDATKKIGWIHNDYDKLGMDVGFDRKYFDRLDEIITVSKECEQVLKKRFPEQVHKISTIHNIVSPKLIKKLSRITNNDLYNRKDGECILLSIGRLHPQKGFDIAVEACARLIAYGKAVRWFIIGEGEEREQLRKTIRKHNVEGQMILLGLKDNPYPYIEQCDIYVQPSRFEGKSVAVDEAKILCKPIVITNFSTARDQIQNGINGTIAPMNAIDLASAIGDLIGNRDKVNELCFRLSNETLGTEEEIDKLYKLVGG